MKLSDFTEKVTKGTTPTSVGFRFQPEGINFIKVESITESEEFLPEKFAHICDDANEKLGRSKLVAGDILFSIAGALGRMAIVTEDILPANTNQALAIIRLEKGLDLEQRFLVYCLKSEFVIQQIAKQKGGVAQQNLSLTQLKNFEFPLPPLEEQKRIVAVLDAAFEGLDRARAHTEANLQNARDLFESQLKNAFENKSKSWGVERLSAVTSKIGSGATPRGGAASYKSEGVSLVRSMNVHDRRFVERKLAFIDDEQAEKLSNVTLEPNDVLLNITGASVARCCVLPQEVLPARVNQHVSILRVHREALVPKFLCYALTSETYKNQLLGIGEEGGATRQAITKAQLQTFEVAFPSLDVQETLVQQLDNAQSSALKLQGHYQAKLTDLDDLRQSLLQKAFAGELT